MRFAVVELLHHIAEDPRVSTAEFINTRNARGLTAFDEAATKLEQVKAEFRAAQNMPHTKKYKNGREVLVKWLADVKFEKLKAVKAELDRVYGIAQILQDYMDYDADEDLQTAGLTDERSRDKTDEELTAELSPEQRAQGYRYKHGHLRQILKPLPRPPKKKKAVGTPQPGLLFTSRCMYQLRKPKEGGGTKAAVSGEAGKPQAGTVSVFECSVRWDADGGAHEDLPARRITGHKKTPEESSVIKVMVMDVDSMAHVFDFTEHSDARGLQKEMSELLIQVMDGAHARGDGGAEEPHRPSAS